MEEWSIGVNYSGGLRRLYAVLSVAWILFALYSVWYRDWHPESIFNGGWRLEGPPELEFRTHWGPIAVACLAPPALGYAVVLIIFPWILKGFHSKNR
jgi:hypothetical protein